MHDHAWGENRTPVQVINATRISVMGLDRPQDAGDKSVRIDSIVGVLIIWIG